MSDTEEFVKTSLKLPLKLWREVKVYAAKEGLKVSQVVETALRRYIELSEGEAKEK
jgi:metal-responsive CopG/Arc/MetJ family transcriptional regulator